MTGRWPAPRVEIDLGKIHHNARTLVERLSARGVAVTGVTKATLGSPAIARTMVAAGINALGDARIENIETMRLAGIETPMWLIRSPMVSQVKQVVVHTELSCNTEPDVMAALSAAATTSPASSSSAAAGPGAGAGAGAGAVRRKHGIVLMVELGDRREGIMPRDLEAMVRVVLRLPGLELRGIGTNLACQSGVAPDADNMAELSALASSIETTFGVSLGIVSGGNSANLTWALGSPDASPSLGPTSLMNGPGQVGIGSTGVGRINNLRLGESILLGCEPLHRTPVDGLHTDAFTLTAEVIESKIKPSMPRGTLGQSAFGTRDTPADRGEIRQSLLAVGIQDVDPSGLVPPIGVTVIGASSDHLIIVADGRAPPVGSEITFGLDYGATVRAMTSPFVAKVFRPVDQAGPVSPLLSADRADLIGPIEGPQHDERVQPFAG